MLSRNHRKAQNAFTRAYTPSSIFFSTHPHIGVRTDDPVIRRLTTPPYPYLIFYEVADDAIIIHAVRHAARDPSEMPGSAQS